MAHKQLPATTTAPATIAATAATPSAKAAASAAATKAPAPAKPPAAPAPAHERLELRRHGLLGALHERDEARCVLGVLLGVEEGVRCARSARAARAPDAVHVVLMGGEREGERGARSSSREGVRGASGRALSPRRRCDRRGSRS